ncbi:hypothetical protein VTN77DRAFT_4150 [Rasamsonia byssochlamydoides]|uniref:uncharacterized protein n=1 Tax=Rasamsonia byssochlamydoides TaxID=89139 RepID=UPI00374350F5
MEPSAARPDQAPESVGEGMPPRILHKPPCTAWAPARHEPLKHSGTPLSARFPAGLIPGSSTSINQTGYGVQSSQTIPLGSDPPA